MVFDIRIVPELGQYFLKKQVQKILRGTGTAPCPWELIEAKTHNALFCNVSEKVGNSTMKCSIHKIEHYFFLDIISQDLIIKLL